MFKRARNLALIIGADFTIASVSIYIAMVLRYETIVYINKNTLLIVVANGLICSILIYVFSGYRHMLRHSGNMLINHLKTPLIVYSFISIFLYTLVGINGVPRSVGLTTPLLIVCGVFMSRLCAIKYFKWKNGRVHDKSFKYILLGVDRSAMGFVESIANNKEFELLALFDGNPETIGRHLFGKVVRDISAVKNYIQNNSVRNVLISEDCFCLSERVFLVNMLSSLHVSVKKVPSIQDAIYGSNLVGPVVNLDIDELLGREPVPANEELMALKITHKVVLVTGAGGSIGSEICRQIIKLCPKKLVLIEQSEFSLYNIHSELTSHCYDNNYDPTNIVPLLGSVTDEQFISRVIKVYKPNTLYHAAAYKHVPIVEHNVINGFYNNAIGTYVIASVAFENNVNDIVLVSTDKAVRPTNIMGASKRFSELIMQAYASRSSTSIYSMVRFGNVLGSSGSVVPKFASQIEKGGPITLTHPEINRYFMSIPEASQLVIQASGLANGGEVFVLDMGEPVKIIDLAKRMIALSGMSYDDGDIEIKVTGLRPGEKLYEELLIGNNPTTTVHPKILMAHEQFIDHEELLKYLKKIRQLCAAGDVYQLVCLLREIPVDYNCEINIVDWISADTNRIQ